MCIPGDASASTNDPLLLSTMLVRDAAIELADAGPADAGRYWMVVSRLSEVLEAGAGRAAILAASPYVVERSGRTRTVVEMIEDEPGDDEGRRRLARLLLRALEWH